jgi:hypothetical protein
MSLEGLVFVFAAAPDASKIDEYFYGKFALVCYIRTLASEPESFPKAVKALTI